MVNSQACGPFLCVGTKTHTAFFVHTFVHTRAARGHESPDPHSSLLELHCCLTPLGIALRPGLLTHPASHSCIRCRALLRWRQRCVRPTGSRVPLHMAVPARSGPACAAVHGTRVRTAVAARMAVAPVSACVRVRAGREDYSKGSTRTTSLRDGRRRLPRAASWP